MQRRMMSHRIGALLTSVVVIGAAACAASDETAIDAQDAGAGIDASTVLSADAAVADTWVGNANLDSSASMPPDSARPPAKCGNGIIEPGEQCDGAAHAGQTCATRGFDDGQLRCTLKCAFDTLKCQACGNGKVEGSESCDGNCPTSCPASNGPCSSWTLFGKASTCDATCVSTPVAGCDPGCPKNTTPSTQFGPKVFTGDFMSEQNRLTGNSQCWLHGPDAVYAWQAPSAGIYDFSMCSMGKFAYAGSTVEHSSCNGTHRDHRGKRVRGRLHGAWLQVLPQRDDSKDDDGRPAGADRCVEIYRHRFVRRRLRHHGALLDLGRPMRTELQRKDLR